MLDWTIAVSALALMVALSDWRKGLAMVVVIAVLQDAFRKLTPDVPSVYVLWSAAIFGFVVLVAWAKHAIGRTRLLDLGDRRLRSAWNFLFIVLLLQIIHTLVRWQSVQLTVLGLLFYMGPVVALLIGAAYVRSEKDLKRFLGFYAAIMVPAALSVYLSPSYSADWAVLRDIGSFVGKEMQIFDEGTVLASHPGVFRVGEIAAWHAATAATFLIILSTRNPSLGFKILAMILVSLLVGAIFLTGRRKMLMTLTIFLVVQWGILAIYRKGFNKQTLVLIGLGVVGSLALTLLDQSSSTGLYYRRATSVFEEIDDRFTTSLDLLASALNRSGGIGLGAGITAQGSQYVAVKTGAAGAAEAGMGKIMVELGIPGVLAALWLLYRLARRILRIFSLASRKEQTELYYGASLFAILVANIATFLVATQVYGDLFVLIMLGVVAGLLFAVCKRIVLARSMPRQQVKRMAGGRA